MFAHSGHNAPQWNNHYTGGARSASMFGRSCPARQISMDMNYFVNYGRELLR
jgi:hypothetical protein